MKEISFCAGGILFRVRPYFFDKAHIDIMRKRLCSSKTENTHPGHETLIEVWNIDNAKKAKNRQETKAPDYFQKKDILKKTEKRLLRKCSSLQKSHKTKGLCKETYIKSIETLRLMQTLDSSFFVFNSTLAKKERHVYIHSATPNRIILLSKPGRQAKIFARIPGCARAGRHFSFNKHIPPPFLLIFSKILHSFSECHFLHSTLLIRRNKGFLFLAPAEGGKTTFSNTARKAKVLSDETNYVYKHKGKWYVGSLSPGPKNKPYKIRKITEAELCGVFYLKKGKKITKRNVDKMQAIYNIQSQIRVENHKTLSGLENHKKAYNFSRELVNRYNPKNLYFSLNDSADEVLEDELKNKNEDFSF